MREKETASQREGLAVDASDYARFIILSGARTGSHMLAQALNSNPSITCFREVFNWLLNVIQYGVEGYDDFSAEDLALRKEDPLRFLDERIFCRHAEKVRAVGFKYHYVHDWGFSGVLERLIEDRGLRVLHLKRRNLLQVLVSLKIAEATGVWLEEDRLEGPKPTAARVLRASGHPLRTAAGLWRRARPPEVLHEAPPAPRVRVSLSVEELRRFIVQMERDAAHYDYFFREHPVLTVYYEDLLEHREEVFAQAQAFLGVKRRRLKVAVRRQNPQPLRELLENYDELNEAFRRTP